MPTLYGYDGTGRMASVRNGDAPGPQETTVPPPQQRDGLVPYFSGDAWVLSAPGVQPNLRPTPPEFMSRSFTFRERVDIRAARATDQVVLDLMTLLDDSRLPCVDLTVPSTRDAILYLTTTTPPLLTVARAEQVLAGLPAPSATATATA